VGKTKESATSTLTKAGLQVKYVEDTSKTVPAGRVISSNPKAGVTLPKGGTVTLTISKGPPLVTVPDLYRTDEQAAVKALRDLGLKVTVTYPIGFTPFGRVVAQSVAAGKQVPWGSTVTLDVV
jgi:serine/threonine-protein kinase